MEQTRKVSYLSPTCLLFTSRSTERRTQETAHSLLTTVQKGLFWREQISGLVGSKLASSHQINYCHRLWSATATRKLTTEVGRQQPERVRSAGRLEGPLENGANGRPEATDKGAKPELSRSLWRLQSVPASSLFPFIIVSNTFTTLCFNKTVIQTLLQWANLLLGSPVNDHLLTPFL